MHTKSEFRKGVRVPKGIIPPLGALAVCLLLALAGTVTAAPVYWTDWTTATPGTVVGTITGAGPDVVEVTYTGNCLFAVVDNSGANYWTPESTYADGSIIDNGPVLKDIIGLIGGDATVHTLTFSRPVVDPVMGIISLGQKGIPVTYDFDGSFDVITNGPGHFGNGPLAEQIGQVLLGEEGHGTIQFQGTLSAIHWTIPTAEDWHGFTVGIGGIGEDPGPVPVPAPGALLLGSVGTCLIGCLRRRAFL